MKLFKSTFRLMIKRPFVLVFLGLLALAYVIFDSYNPVLPILLGLNTLTGGDLFENLVSFLQFLLDPGVIPVIGLFLLIFSVVAAVVSGLLFSGYFNIVNNAVNGRSMIKGEFRAGMKRYFPRMSFISFSIILVGFLLAVFLSVASVPAMIITNSADISKPELIAAAVLVDILTAGVLFFGFMFFRAYLFFWYPAAMNYNRKPFAAAKRVVDKHFWSIAGRFIAFDIVFAAFQFAFANMEDSYVLFALKWVFWTIFLSLFITYVFSAFRIYNIDQDN